VIYGSQLKNAAKAFGASVGSKARAQTKINGGGLSLGRKGTAATAQATSQPTLALPQIGSAATTTAAQQAAQGSTVNAIPEYQLPAAQQAGVPFDFTSMADLASLEQSYAAQNAAIAAKKDSLKQMYGVNASGALDFDNPTDPYSQAALLKRYFRLTQQGQTQGQFGRGTGYDGSAELQDARLGENQREKSTELQRSYDRDVGSLNDQQLSNQLSYQGQKARILAALAEVAMRNNAVGAPAVAVAPSAPGRNVPDPTMEEIYIAMNPDPRQGLLQQFMDTHNGLTPSQANAVFSTYGDYNR
jgi:hypothetical protein